MAGGEPRLGTTATYMRYNDHGTTRLSTEIDILHDRIHNEYRVFSAGSVRKWSKFGLNRESMMPDSFELRKRAKWYREFAERAGAPWVWEARLKTAKQLEAEAVRVEPKPTLEQERDE